MNKKAKKFLGFNGRTLTFLKANGNYLIAISPICDVLGMEYDFAIKDIYQDPVLTAKLSHQNMLSPDGKFCNYICLPEFYIYGWLMGLNSTAPGLDEYKRECFRVLQSEFRRS